MPCEGQCPVGNTTSHLPQYEDMSELLVDTSELLVSITEEYKQLPLNELKSLMKHVIRFILGLCIYFKSSYTTKPKISFTILKTHKE